MRSILESEGYDVVEAEDGLAALERYFLEKPDLVLLDLVMRGMTGLDVLKKLQEMDAQAVERKGVPGFAGAEKPTAAEPSPTRKQSDKLAALLRVGPDDDTDWLDDVQPVGTEGETGRIESCVGNTVATS